MIRGPLLHGHETKGMPLPIINQLEFHDSIRPNEGFFFLTFQRKLSIEGLVFSSLPKKISWQASEGRE